MKDLLSVARFDSGPYRRLRAGRTLLSIVLLLLLATPVLAKKPISDQPNELRPLSGDTDSFAVEINNHGMVVGRSSGPNGDSAVVWDRRGRISQLMLWDDDDQSLAEGVNNRGQVAGISRDSSFSCPVDTAVIWDRHGVPHALPKLDASHSSSRAFAINDRGEVIGTSLGPVNPDCTAIFHPVKWDRHGNITQLPFLPGFGEGFAQDVNNRGDVVGGSIDFAIFPYITGQTWGKKNSNTPMAPPAGYYNTAANGINNNGMVVGETFDFWLDRAVVWDRKGNATTLDPLGDDSDSTGQAINNRGEVAGSSGAELFGFWGPGTAVIWDKKGNPTALHPLTGGERSFGIGINDRGQVVGHSVDDDTGVNTAVIWK